MVFASSKYWVPKPVTDVVAVKDLNNEDLIALEYDIPCVHREFRGHDNFITLVFLG